MSRIVRLRLDDGVEIAAIGDIDRDLAQPGHSTVRPSAWRKDGTLVMRTSRHSAPSCR